MIELFVLFFVAGNFFLQFGWFIWSYNIHRRKHFTDSGASANAEIDLITSIQTYVDAKVENEIVIKKRDEEWSEFMSKPTDVKDEPETAGIIPKPEKGPDGKYNPSEVKGAFDNAFE